jgi:tetratricopeptide (TPR) repeat protein
MQSSFEPRAILPKEGEALAGLYRSILHGKRALLLLDNAKDAAQVEPLIPPAGCALLVTSRIRFTLPGFQAIGLNCLPPGKAEELLLKIEPRIGGDVRAIAKLCGYLPRSLRLVASALEVKRDLAPADYAKRLADDPLKELAASAASINQSYKLLDADMQKQWRILGIFPETFDRSAAASVWQVENERAQEALSELLRYSMLEWNDKAKRYRMHDLNREFARQELTQDEHNEVASRHSAYYMNVLNNAEALYEKGGESLTRGLALFDLERGNIEAGQGWAADHMDVDPEAAQLCNHYAGLDPRAYCLALRQNPRDVIAWCNAALTSARRSKDRPAEGRHLNRLGSAHWELGDTHHAILCCKQSLAIASEISYRRLEAAASCNLGLAYARMGETRRAIKYYEQQLNIAREVGASREEALALGYLGLAYTDLNENRQAVQYHKQHLVVARKIGDRQAEGVALGNLGRTYFRLGKTLPAVDYCKQALTIHREFRDRRAESYALGRLGMATEILGDRSRAMDYCHQHLDITREIGDREGECGALAKLGILYRRSGDFRRAIEYDNEAFAIARQIGAHGAEGGVLFNMSLALYELGDLRNAIGRAEDALEVYRKIRHPFTDAVRKQIEEWHTIEQG